VAETIASAHTPAHRGMTRLSGLQNTAMVYTRYTAVTNPSTNRVDVQVASVCWRDQRRYMHHSTHAAE